MLEISLEGMLRNGTGADSSSANDADKEYLNKLDTLHKVVDRLTAAALVYTVVLSPHSWFMVAKAEVSS